MSNYTIEVHRYYTYEIELDAEDVQDAIEQARDWAIEDMEDFEKDSGFTFEVIGYPDEQA